MKILSRIFPLLILCAVSFFNISALSPGQQLFSGGFPGTGSLCIAGDDVSAPDMHLLGHGAPEDHQKSKAARIYQRNHEQLIACCNAVPEERTTSSATWLPAKEPPIANAEFNSICLSSCYDYIFRLCPF